MPTAPVTSSRDDSGTLGKNGHGTAVRGWVRSTLRALLALYIPFFALTIALQMKSGTYGSEFGHEPDEPGHVVSALMVHDYIASRFPVMPLRYAETYYIHYPKVAIGIWPPVFHTVAALWMLIFPATHTSLLVLMAAQCSLVAVMIAWFVRRWFGPALGFLSGVLFISFYLVQYGTTLFMLDIMVSLMDFTSTLLLIRFFKTEKVRDGAWFGLATAIATLVKGNAIALVLMPAVLILLLRRWSILKRAGLYVAAAIVVVIGAPWQLVSLHMINNTVPMSKITAPYIAHMVTGYGALVLESTGYIVLALFAIGLAAELWRAIEAGGHDPRSIEMMGVLAMALSVYVFHCIAPVPGPDSRYITPVLIAVAVFFAAGSVWLADRLKVGVIPQPWRATVLAAALMAVYAGTTFAVPSRPPMGFIPTADALSWPEVQNGVILIASDGFGEGAFVSEMALRDHRPSKIILRGSKVISEGQWSVHVYQPLLKSPEEIEKYLVSVGVDAVVIDVTSPMWKQDTDMLLQAMHDNPKVWQLHSEVPASGSQRNIRIYRYTGPRDPASRPDIQLRMRHMLGRDLKL